MIKGFPVPEVRDEGDSPRLVRGLAALRRLARPACLALVLVVPLSLAETPPTLLVMGDSLSAAYGIEQQEGWVSLLESRLDGKARVVNASISGETSSGGASRLPDLLGQHEPDIVLLELGGNDGLRGLPPRQFEANMADMIEASQAADAEVLLLGIDIPPNYGQAYRDAFTGVYHRLAEEYEVPLVPFLLEGIALDANLMQSDGIHPTAAAQPRILETVWPALAEMLEEEHDIALAEAQD